MKDEIRSLLESNLNIILTGAPGTGKTHTAKEVAKELAGDETRIESVQFHPGYDYSDFVVGMKPVLLSNKGVELEMKGGQYVRAGTDEIMDETGEAKVSFRWKDGIFKTFANKAANALDAWVATAGHRPEDAPRYVFLIDEINRADLSRVFGELFSLLEEEYRYPKNEKGIKLPNGEDFVLPRNLYVIGTMNDIDRSVESMDFALRRRFAWLEVKPEDTADEILEKIPEKDVLRAKMDAVNELIRSPEIRLGSEYQLGGAIFAKFAKYAGKDDAFDTLWENHISNILSEYLRSHRDRDEWLKKLRERYDAVIARVHAAGENSVGTKAVSGGARGPNKRFRIVLQDGNILAGDNGKDVLVNFVKRLDDGQIDKVVQDGGITRSGRPLLVRENPNDRENYTLVEGKGCYVVTKSGTAEKVNQVNKIAELLHLDVKAELMD